MPWASDHRLPRDRAGRFGKRLADIEHRALDPRRTGDPHAEVLAADLLAELDRECRARRRYSSDSASARTNKARSSRCPAAAISRTAWTSRRLLNAARCAGVAVIEAAACGGARDRPAQPLERQLAVEQLGISRGALEIAVGLRMLPGGERCAARPNNSPWSGPAATARRGHSGRTSRPRWPGG